MSCSKSDHYIILLNVFGVYAWRFQVSGQNNLMCEYKTLSNIGTAIILRICSLLKSLSDKICIFV